MPSSSPRPIHCVASNSALEQANEKDAGQIPVQIGLKHPEALRVAVQDQQSTFLVQNKLRWARESSCSSGSRSVNLGFSVAVTRHRRDLTPCDHPDAVVVAVSKDDGAVSIDLYT